MFSELHSYVLNNIKHSALIQPSIDLPQSIMTGDSHNNIFGRTLNPRNKLLTPGGSTGGEGALLALRGSILGVGTDIGGSIRVPSVCSGLYGFRPSVGLIPHGGVRDLTPPGSDVVKSTAGPMATSLRDCEMFLKVILEAEAWKYDSSAIAMPWVEIEARKKRAAPTVVMSGVPGLPRSRLADEVGEAASAASPINSRSG